MKGGGKRLRCEIEESREHELPQKHTGAVLLHGLGWWDWRFAGLCEGWQNLMAVRHRGGSVGQEGEQDVVYGIYKHDVSKDIEAIFTRY